MEAVLHWRGQHAQAIRERDALQLLLNDRDEQLHSLEQSRRAEFDNGRAAEQVNSELRTELARVHDHYYGRLLSVVSSIQRARSDTDLIYSRTPEQVFRALDEIAAIAHPTKDEARSISTYAALNPKPEAGSQE
ncbi:hypothetical protein [Pseudomonas koreensis]|uniref:hypothetical protein n=1 Tax=Pseudomonas koreensis TaxID=198620 RepID=UPI0020775A8F|nr:hypothetical protein [Pseudomonas koreensis]MCM8743583.1 hypothetical protein [Pseudomonas koreensis]